MEERIKQLFKQMEALEVRQLRISREINELRKEISELQKFQVMESLTEKEEAENIQPILSPDTGREKEKITPEAPTAEGKFNPEFTKYTNNKSPIHSSSKSITERFIGENLINKVGIIITIIGVVIGAKYTIEHQLISPLTRIISGYLLSLGLFGFGIKLKKDYENYSAVLVSGAMAIMYFITYAAYSFYNLMPQAAAFVLMVVFTVFTVIVSINYNKQVIALIGLVGAYGVPFLLSRDSGRVDILFSYIAIINFGILFIAHKKYWKTLYYSSFFVTWLIFFSWFTTSFQADKHFVLSLTFLTVYFVTFYLILLDYKLLQKEKFDAGDIILLLANSFIFYGIGYSILKTNPEGRQLSGLFTLCNAIPHSVVSMLIFRQKLADKNLFYLVTGLVLTFITIAIPIQLNGNWVTLLWACEAALLFSIGRTQNVQFYEALSYLLVYLTFFSIIHDWLTLYNHYNPDQPGTRLTPIFNINFLTSLFCIASFGFINYLKNRRNHVSPFYQLKELNSIIRFSVPAILIVVIYFSFRMEIAAYMNRLYIDSALKDTLKNTIYHNSDILKFKTILLINYSLLFVALLSFVNNRRIKSHNLGLISISLAIIIMMIFLTLGLYIISELRDSYINQVQPAYFYRGSFNIWIRYISIGFAGLMLISLFQAVRQKLIEPVSINLKIWFDFVLHISLLWIVSSELINWMDILRFQQSYKLGLSILWGLYSLMLIVLGIWKRKKHLRIGAIVLFGITLLKLFYYDISYLDTIGKTIVFVALGLLLLIISFLYNKYRCLISEESEP